MANLLSLSTEVLEYIIGYLQSASSGPRYLIRPQNLDGETPEQRDCKEFVYRGAHKFIVNPRDLDSGIPAGRHKRGEHVYQWSPGHDIRLCWKLVDPGAFYLGSTCRKLWNVYLSSSVANNLILEVPDIDLPKDDLWRIWGTNDRTARSNRRDGLLKRLGRVKEGRRGIPLTRFMLDCRLANQYTLGLWTDILETVNEVFGDELLVVTCCMGDSAKDLVPSKIQDLQALENPMIRVGSSRNRDGQLKFPSPETARTELTRGRKVIAGGGNASSEGDQHEPKPRLHPRARQNPRKPDSSVSLSPLPLVDSPPLSLHLHIGESAGDTFHALTAATIKAFGNRALKHFYYSNPSRLMIENPWKVLTSLEECRAITTLEELTLDCTVSWFAIDKHSPLQELPKFENLKIVDFELLRFWSLDLFRLVGFPDTATKLAIFRESCLDNKGKAFNWVGDGDKGVCGNEDGSMLPACFSWDWYKGNDSLSLLEGPMVLEKTAALRLERSKRE